MQTDRLLVCILRVGATVAALVMLLIMMFLLVESWPALTGLSLIRFVTDAAWHPLEGAYHLMPMLLATLLASIGALMLAVPLGLASAVFIVFLHRRVWRWCISG